LRRFLTLLTRSDLRLVGEASRRFIITAALPCSRLPLPCGVMQASYRSGEKCTSFFFNIFLIEQFRQLDAVRSHTALYYSESTKRIKLI
jgi:hypothetical protein